MEPTNEAKVEQFFAAWKDQAARKAIVTELDDRTLGTLLAFANDAVASVLAEHDRRKTQDILTPKSTVEPI